MKNVYPQQGASFIINIQSINNNRLITQMQNIDKHNYTRNCNNQLNGSTKQITT